ncbi:MAG: PhoH family protein [Brevundimonas sp.]|uniref:PhoH family protein n=1 Tax=Brevundimonas sp. TaxID=1871086 RepID=UPI00391BFAA8
MARASEYIALSEAALAAVTGPSDRHTALIEDAMKVLIETPGGGVSITGSPKDRIGARRVIEALSERAEQGVSITEADVRALLGPALGHVRARARDGAPSTRPSSVLPVGRRGPIAPKTAAQARYLEALKGCELTFGVGPAGTGKTFIAAAYGASLLRAGEVDRLVVTRPAVEAGERLGFLPGDLNEKVDPYLAPIWQALDEILGAAELTRRRDRGEVEVVPLAFMRGRTLSHAFVIVDEAQNTTRLQMKMVLTRLGEGARMAVTGDPSQVDLVNGRDSGLEHAVRLLEGVEGVGVSRFEAGDVVRHALVERIVRAYDRDAEASRGARGERP